MDQLCINCGQSLIPRGQVWLCPSCNSQELHETLSIFDGPLDDGHLFIECPGATVYEPGTDTIVAGVRFLNENDATRGFEVVDHQVFSPTHTKRRLIKKDALGKIRRCQGCQDYTVRLRRPEGPDFCIPSPKHPGRTKLRSVTPTLK
jgi:hypothetical protein